MLAEVIKLLSNLILLPGNIKAVSINGKNINNEIVSKTALFFFIYFVILFVSVILISIDGKDIVSSTTAVIASLSNIGPGLGIVGHAENYSAFSPFSKVILSFCMIAGRLEFYPVLVLFTPSVWKKGLIK
ncbi:MAG TPA: potassium transporter TrkG [Clostridia bacterium]|nr:potassium transporter TrkG [Clostridia bacterium]